MTEEKFADILAKQVPDSDKRAAADFIVDSSVSVADAHRQVKEILAAVRDEKCGVAGAAGSGASPGQIDEEKRKILRLFSIGLPVRSSRAMNCESGV